MKKVVFDFEALSCKLCIIFNTTCVPYFVRNDWNFYQFLSPTFGRWPNKSLVKQSKSFYIKMTEVNYFTMSV